MSSSVAPAVDKAVLADLHRSILRIRLAEQRIVEIYPTDKIQSPIHLSIGQEAVCAGVCRALQPQDHLYGTYRGHGIYLAKGGTMEGMFAELYGKDTGCARGRGGSMHLVAPEAGLMACSAIVASTIPVAVGDALAAQLQGRRRLSVAFFGDGAIDEGVFFESLNFAALKKLPALFILENNRYAIHSRVGDRRAQTELFRIGEGLGVSGERFDGNDAAEVYAATAKAAKDVLAGGPPRILEFMTYRWREHVGAGADFKEAYREPGEEARTLAADPLELSRKRLLEAGFSAAELERMEAEARAEIERAVAFAEKSPFPTPEGMLGEVYAPAPAPAAAAEVRPTTMKYRQALHTAIHRAMESDPSVLVMGIGVDDHKGTFGSTEGLVERFGRARVFDTPIAEGAMTGIALGAAVAGMKPVHVHIRTDFLYLAMDQLLNMAAKWRFMFGGRMSAPMVVRAVIGRSWGQGAQHSQALQSLFAHVPGIKVAMPTTPSDAHDLLLSAIADPNPVLLIEHRLLYEISGEVRVGAPPQEFRRAAVRRHGKDLTIVANSYMAVESLKAAEFLAQHGIEAEIVDPVTLAPFDDGPVLESVRRTGRLLIADSGWTACGFGAEVAAVVAEKAFSVLKAPVRRLGFAATPCPVSKPLEHAFYPDAGAVAAAAFSMLDRKAPDLRAPALTTTFKGPF
ncbi:MAG TPA: thiamine pyrophosphate-dependent enzyme [Elusimicrobiota bacterium]|nr:thiamine pyrophosphate-dependent enzyme [Elusimicrobiota bacterium]